MRFDAQAAFFIMLGQIAEKTVADIEETVPKESLLLSPSYNLATLVPDKVRRSTQAAESYKLFFVFENYLRELVIETLSRDSSQSWWEKLPTDVQTEISRLEEAEEVKSWMALGSRDKSALMTLPQLLRTIDHSWKEGFDDIVRDKGLLQEARLLVHLRNTICHMSPISSEENARLRQTLRDWFRIVAP